ncbi:DUF1016 N-terminal domain-containing protein [Pseudarthrobacter sulfonivorans]|uniref:DUF1016 N-terminal domain-containing protein n=1 Tax=Pseudarthrobacter sulfonivorans TaxID=121292 RepID=UPI001CC2F384
MDGPNEFVQTVSAQIIWSHDVALLDQWRDQELREWYASRSARHGWSLSVLDVLTADVRNTGVVR